MVNNSTNYSKTNNRLSPQLTDIEHKKRPQLITGYIGNPHPGLGQSQKCGRVKAIIEIPTQEGLP